MVITEEINGTGFYKPGTQELVQKHPRGLDAYRRI
jgi:hypothetical protein